MTSSSVPIILLVPGAFGTPAGYDPILPYLKEAGFTTHPGPYPSSNPRDPSAATCENDIASLREDVLRPLLDEGKDVIILAHSYGGIVAGAAAKDPRDPLDKQTRKSQGQAGGVVGLIYIAGNMTLDKESLADAIGGTYPDFIKLDKPAQGLALIEPAMDILYNDCEPADAKNLDDSVVPHAYSAFFGKATAPAWADTAFNGRRAYIRTLDDCCNPTSVQDLWLAKTKVEWGVVDFKSGHMPFISQPEALAVEIVKLAKGFAAL